MILQIELRILAPLSDTLFAVGVPGAGLLNDPRFRRNVHEQRLVADALVEHDVELGLSERRGGPFFYPPHTHGGIAHHLPAPYPARAAPGVAPPSGGI